MVTILQKLCFFPNTNRLLTANDHDFDVVLIDTAGRMQDNEVHSPSVYLLYHSECRFDISSP